MTAATEPVCPTENSPAATIESKRKWHVRVLAGSLFPTAGSHVYNGELIRRLVNRGHHVSAVALDDGGLSWPGTQLTVLPISEMQLPGLWRFQTRLQAREARRRLCSAELETPDVVIATEHFFARPHARRFPGVPWLYLPHSLTVRQEIESYGLRELQGWITRQFYVQTQRWELQHATATVRFNRFAVETLRAEYGALARHTRFVINPPGVDFPNSGWTIQSPGAGETARLLFVGRLVPSKNFELVLQTLVPLRGGNWRLDVLGDGPLRSSLEEAVRAQGLEGQIQFHGNQRDTASWYRRADLLLFPSLLESMGLVLLESMALGTPALCIRGDGDRYRVPFEEVITDGGDGLLALNEEDFRQRLADAIRCPASLQPLRAKARETIRARFCWERHLNDYEALFASIAR